MLFLPQWPRIGSLCCLEILFMWAMRHMGLFVPRKHVNLCFLSVLIDHRRSSQLIIEFLILINVTAVAIKSSFVENTRYPLFCIYIMLKPVSEMKMIFQYYCLITVSLHWTHIIFWSDGVVIALLLCWVLPVLHLSTHQLKHLLKGCFPIFQLKLYAGEVSLML